LYQEKFLAIQAPDLAIIQTYLKILVSNGYLKGFVR